MFKAVGKVLDYADKNGLYPDLPIIETGAEPEVIIDGKKVLMFASNNYLGLATHPALKNVAIEATKKIRCRVRRLPTSFGKFKDSQRF
jgi:7-keto-8-aminopelargonate synthetase-like enzyme